MKKVKICGITEIEEAEYLNEARTDYAGFVQFFPQSKRNISPQKASSIIKELDSGILPVAVTVCPTAEQLHIIEQTGFRIVQIHGNISDALLDSISIPIIKAFNVSDLSQYERFQKNDRVIGYIFDAQAPGEGKTFDWSLLKNIPLDTKPALLAGGLTPENVAAALKATGLWGADTSSGVENDNGIGKSRKKIMEFVKAVHSV
ncbi:MAG: phosphoribosylanthranilate isomerase [Lachnospiraceae bacterium]|nr:phosphoribosylanthranilate isomerase [Lachnospiraceae bacterium]MDE6625064.1 phosphoribosylanthranilate isomerase [Lachnospiraceae bacterium]